MLHCHSYYSFLDGASSPEELADVAAQQGWTAIALTDRDGLYGVIPFYRQCREQGIQPLIGADLSIEGRDRIIVLCKGKEGYHALSRLISQSYEGREKGAPWISKDMLATLRGKVCVLIGNKESLLAEQLRKRDRKAAARYLESYQSYFPDNLYVELSFHWDEGDRALCDELKQVAELAGLPMVASNAVRYATKEQGRLYDVLRCIHHRVTLRESQKYRPGNQERYLKSPEQMAQLFSSCPELEASWTRIVKQCQIELEFSSYRLPDFPVPDGQDGVSYLESLCLQRLPEVYPSPTSEHWAKLSYELDLIAKLKLSGYFLVVWDIVQFARRKGIPVQGRGSAANSLVAYVLGITPVDPIRHKLFLGRFINEDMVKIPDIDLDFASSRDPDSPDREDVIRYVYERYGREHVAMVCTFVTFQARSAIREVGKVFEFPDFLLDQLARLCGRSSVEASLREIEQTKEAQPYVKGRLWEQFVEILDQISEVPRHTGIHVGGMIIASRPISDLVPIEPARMEGRTLCQWDKDMVEDAGLIKVDILGLGMLAVLREAQQLIEQDTGDFIDLFHLPHDDPKVYQTLSQADTVGVFQVESRAQMQSLPRTRPQNFDELGIQVAIIRPGPLQGNMVSPYIRRKQGDEAVEYLHPNLQGALEDTLGVILFQEQVLQVAVAIAGFSPAEAEGLRRAMSRKRSKEAMEGIRGRFLEGASNQGISEELALRVFASLEGFALYGFCKSHALSFARISYLSAWLKVYHHGAFTAALLNNQPMGFYPNSTLLADAQRHGVEVLPCDINTSGPRCQLDQRRIRLGLNLVCGLKQSSIEKVLNERETRGAFVSMRDFYKRTLLSRRELEKLVQAGVFDTWGLERRELLWQLWLVEREKPQELSLFDLEPTAPHLPLSDVWDLLNGEYGSMGLSLQAHPIALLRPHYPGTYGASDLESLPAGASVRVLGVVVCRQRPPTAKGFAFVTLEDEAGLINLVVPPQVYSQFRSIFRNASMVEAEGHIDRRESLVNVRTYKLNALAKYQP